jgi:hypothetical protein
LSGILVLRHLEGTVAALVSTVQVLWHGLASCCQWKKQFICKIVEKQLLFIICF